MWRMWKQRRALTADIADDSCVACDSRDLTSLGEDAYLCNACGYEGGSGLVRMQDAAQAEMWASWTPEKRRASALADLKEARTFLRSAEGRVEGAAGASRMDMIGLSSDNGSDVRNTKQTELSGAMGDMEIARKHLRDAQKKLGEDVSLLHSGPEETFSWELEQLWDGLLTDLNMHARINETRKRVATLITEVTTAIEAMEAATP